MNFNFDSVPAIAILGTLAIVLYYGVVLLFTGRAQRGETIVVRYEPPTGMSSASVRYLRGDGFDERAFTSAILSLASKDIIRIDEKDEGYSISSGEGDADTLPDDEKALAGALMPKGFGFDLNKENHDRVFGAIRALKLALDQGIEKKYLQTHGAFLVVGLCCSTLLILYLAFISNIPQVSYLVFLTVFFVLWSTGDVILVLYLVHLVRSAKWLRKRTGNSSGSILSNLLFAIPFLAIDLVLMGVLIWLSSVWFLALLLIHMLLVPVAHMALKSPTKSGRGMLDQIEGFRRFMSEVETAPMGKTNRLPQTRELFEKYLSYAFALDVEDKWAHQFEDTIAADSIGELEEPTNAMTTDLVSLDLTAFGLFV
jgi:hypothetical protein